MMALAALDNDLCAICNHPYLFHAGYGGPCLDCRGENRCMEFVSKKEDGGKDGSSSA